MKRGECIRLVRRAARSKELVFSAHALDEMVADGETRASVAAVLQHGKSWALQDNGRWRVQTENLAVIVQVHEEKVIVWTVFTC